MARLHMSLSRMMMLVALCAVSIYSMIRVGVWCKEMWLLRQDYQSRALHYGRREAFCDSMLKSELTSLQEVDNHNEDRRQRAKSDGIDGEDMRHLEKSMQGLHDQVDRLVEWFRNDTQYYALMKAKYLDAASHPWRPVPPDHPKPPPKKKARELRQRTEAGTGKQP
jgi:hypothetical protein